MKNLLFTIIFQFCILLIFAQQASVGQMYFSSKPFGNSHDGAITNFSTTDNIYARIELDSGTIESYFHTNKSSSTNKYTLHVAFKVSKNGVEMSYYPPIPKFLYITPNDKKNAVLNFDIRPSLKDASTFYTPSDRRDDNYTTSSDFYSLPFQGAADYTIDVIVKNGYDYGKEAKIIGTFHFNYSPNSNTDFTNEDNAVTKKLRESATSLSKLPTALSSPAKSADPEVTYEKIKALLKIAKPGTVLLKLGLEQPSGSIWSVGNNSDGTIRQKSFIQNIVFAFKEDGKCKIGTFYVRKSYLGYGKYDKLSIGGFSEEIKTIDCVKVK